jgi:hypothetical protein
MLDVMSQRLVYLMLHVKNSLFTQVIICAYIAKCQGTQCSYWHIRQVKVKLQKSIKITSNITSYTIAKTAFLKRFNKITKIITFNTFLKIVKWLVVSTLESGFGIAGSSPNEGTKHQCLTCSGKHGCNLHADVKG